MQIFNTIPATTIIQKKLQESFPDFFWDIDTNKLDLKDHYKLIITQAINYGSVQTIKNAYPVDPQNGEQCRFRCLESASGSLAKFWV